MRTYRPDRRATRKAVTAQNQCIRSDLLAAAATGAVPVSLEPLFAALPETDQTDARVTFAAFQMACRLDPMTAMIAGAAGLSDTEIDAIWTGYVSV